MKPVIAAFDFDGTLTKRDTLVSFLRHIVGSWVWLVYLIKLLPILLAYRCGMRTRQQTKEGVLHQFIGGIQENQLFEWGASFAQSKVLSNLVKPTAMDRLRWHQQQGHRCILVSASLETYLIPWSKAHAFDDVIASRLKINAEGTASGQLRGLNCRGAEKTRRLLALLGPKENFILYAYGDSDGDHELLALADYPFFREFS